MPEIEIAPQTNIKELVRAAADCRAGLTAFGLGCSGCGRESREQVREVEQGARGARPARRADRRRTERGSSVGSVPKIAEESRRPAARARAPLAAVRSSRTRFRSCRAKAASASRWSRAARRRAPPQELSRRHHRRRYHRALDPRLFGLHSRCGSKPTGQTTPAGSTAAAHASAVTRQRDRSRSARTSLPAQEDKAMIWRGPIVAGVIRQFYEQYSGASWTFYSSIFRRARPTHR